MTGTLSDETLNAIRARTEIGRALDELLCPARAAVRELFARKPLKLRLQSSTTLSNAIR